MSLRAALGQLADGLGCGVLGLTRSCWGASCSGAAAVGDGAPRLARISHWAAASLALPGAAPPGGVRDALLPGSRPTGPGRSGALPPLRPPGDAAAAGPAAGALSAQPSRGYKSNKRPLKPLNTAASWAALQPLLAAHRARKALLPPPQTQPNPTDPAAAATPLFSPRLRRRGPPLGPILDTCLPPVPPLPTPPEYERVGAITGGRYKLTPERAFAVVALGGTQFKVTTDDIVFVHQLPGVEVNDVLCLGRVLLLGSPSDTVVGRPFVPGGFVLAAVEEHFRDGKVHVFKKKRKKRYRKYQAPRPNLTTLRILQVDCRAGAEQAQQAGWLSPRGRQLLLGEGDVDVAAAAGRGAAGAGGGEEEEEEEEPQQQQQQQRAKAGAAAGSAGG